MRFVIIFLIFSFHYSYAKNSLNSDKTFSIHAGSYLKHIIPSSNDFTEKFDNKFF